MKGVDLQDTSTLAPFRPIVDVASQWEKSMSRLDEVLPAGRRGLVADHPSRDWWDQFPLNVLAYRRGVKGTRIGFVDLEIPGLYLRIDDCVVHRHSTSGTCWIQIPARVGEGTGASGFKTVVSFTDKAVCCRLSDRVVRQLAEQYPEDFADFAQGELL